MINQQLCLWQLQQVTRHSHGNSVLYRSLNLQKMQLSSAGTIVKAGKERIRVVRVQFTSPQLTTPPPQLHCTCTSIKATNKSTKHTAPNNTKQKMTFGVKGRNAEWTYLKSGEVKCSFFLWPNFRRRIFNFCFQLWIKDGGVHVINKSGIFLCITIQYIPSSRGFY